MEDRAELQAPGEAAQKAMRPLQPASITLVQDVQHQLSVAMAPLPAGQHRDLLAVVLVGV